MNQEIEKVCYNCRHVQGNKFYEFFCHYKLTGAFVEHGKPVDPNNTCEYFDYTDLDKKRRRGNE